MMETTVEQSLDNQDLLFKPAADVNADQAEQVIDWNKRLRERFFKKPGEHMLITGANGTGKTQFLYYLVKGHLKYGRDTITWNDIGKSSEVLRLLTFAKCRFIIRKYMTLDVKINESYKEMVERIQQTGDPDWPVDIVEVDTYEDAWRAVKPNVINIMSFKRHIATVREYSQYIGESFEALIRMAEGEKIPLPMRYIGDEFHWVCPERNNALDYQHYANGAIIQYDIETLRSMGVGLDLATHQVTKIRKGVRDECKWKAIKPGTYFDYENKKLNYYNYLWQAQDNNNIYIADERQRFTPKMTLPFYGDGNEVGKIRYAGKVELLKEGKETKVSTQDTKYDMGAWG